MKEDLLTEMAALREVVTKALEARTKSNIKVRQPIVSVTGPDISEEMRDIVLDELNAKSYEVGTEVGIDTMLTSELIAEGAVRELMRAVQGARKNYGLEPSDEIVLRVNTDENGQNAIKANYDLLVKTVGANEVSFETLEGDVAYTEGYSFRFVITKL